jgi:hypothetical protein
MVMSREQDEQARRVSELVDGLVLHRRYQRTERPVSEDREFRQLSELARSLSDVTVEPPEDFQRELVNSIRRRGATQERVPRFPFIRARTFLRAVTSSRIPKLVPALPSAAVVAFLVAFVARSVYDLPVASASEILTRSDAAIVKLVRPGQLLYRRWRVTSTTTSADGKEVRHGNTHTIREWMDGADFDRVAGRWYSADDRLLIAYTSIGTEGQRRPNAYFSPGVYGEIRGALNIEPTLEEYRAAAHRFPPDVERALNVYLDRQYIYLPITGERRFNRAMIESHLESGTGPLPRVVLSFDTSQVNGTPVYRVQAVDPASIDFNWRSEGPPRVRLAWAKIVRYIARDSYLSVRSEETLKFVDGRTRVTTRELLETRAISTRDLSLDPFKLDVPDGTPVQHQSAFDQLSGVANAYSQLPELTATLVERQHH